MPRVRGDLEAAILSELRARVAALREKPYEDLALLPAARSDATTVRGERVTFTVLREHRPDRGLLVLVRSDRRILLGLGTAGTTEGFWVSPDGEMRDAYGDEIADLFG